jgi:RimJ/RimL family protein N-acetyltransferase
MRALISKLFKEKVSVPQTVPGTACEDRGNAPGTGTSVQRVWFESERLLLREFEEDDSEGVLAYASDPEVVRYMLFEPADAAGARHFVRLAMARANENERHYWNFAVILKSENRLVGGCSLQLMNPDHREAEYGIALSRRHWGLGLGREASAGAFVVGFRRLGLHRIFATCDPGNIAVQKMNESLGMRREGHLRECRWARERWHDRYLYAILDWEWAQVNRDDTVSERRPDDEVCP